MKDIKIYSKNEPMPREKFHQLYSIMEYSFPPTERGSEALQYSEYNRSEFRCLCYEPDGIPQAFIDYYEFPEERTAFVEHFAVASSLRGKGTGTSLLRHYMNITAPYLTVLEVEPPDGAVQCRRIAFYQRMGFFLNMGEYFQPDFYNGGAVIPLKLMTTQPISDERFLALRSFIYSRVYRTHIMPENTRMI